MRVVARGDLGGLSFVGKQSPWETETGRRLRGKEEGGMTEGEGRIEQEALRGNAVKADVMVGRRGR